MSFKTTFPHEQMATWLAAAATSQNAAEEMSPDGEVPRLGT